MKPSGYVAIVDDDASMRTALARLLRVHGINSLNYASARAFLEALASHIPDCLIADVNMPDMTGIELQRELLNCDFRIPTIVITASDNKKHAASAVSLGAVAFFLKPVPQDALIAAVHSAQKRRTVVDWLSACRSGQLNALLDLYEKRATLICDCDGINLVGRDSLAIYWKSKLESKVTGAFALDDIVPTGDDILVDCQSCKGRPVRIHFQFGSLGRIIQTHFVPLPRSFA